MRKVEAYSLLSFPARGVFPLLDLLAVYFFEKNSKLQSRGQFRRVGPPQTRIEWSNFVYLCSVCILLVLDLRVGMRWEGREVVATPHDFEACAVMTTRYCVHWDHSLFPEERKFQRAAC